MTNTLRMPVVDIMWGWTLPEPILSDVVGIGFISATPQGLASNNMHIAVVERMYVQGIINDGMEGPVQAVFDSPRHAATVHGMICAVMPHVGDESLVKVFFYNALDTGAVVGRREYTYSMSRQVWPYEPPEED